MPLKPGARPRAEQLLAQGTAFDLDTAPWKELAAGPPRLAEPSDLAASLSSAPTPGPGDSDGGDVFAP